MVAYTPKLAEIICRRLADGESLRKICLDADMPNRSTVFDWLDKIEGFQAAYDKAHERQGHLMAGLALEAALHDGQVELRSNSRPPFALAFPSISASLTSSARRRRARPGVPTTAGCRCRSRSSVAPVQETTRSASS
jgi:hypothetical protein